jgi:hypothetical protein
LPDGGGETRRLSRSPVERWRPILAFACVPCLWGCGPDLSGSSWDSPTFNVTAPGCDEVLAGPLLISSLEEPLEVGASRLVGVTGPGPFDLLAAVCDGRLESVTWASLDPAIVHVDTSERGFGAYVTGVSLGVASVTAEVVLLDGRAPAVSSAEVSVVPASGPPTEAELVVANTLVFETASTSCPSSSSSCSHEHFTLERRGELIVIADWGSPLNRVDFNVFNGHCSDTSTCHVPTVLDGGRLDGKPIRVSTQDVPAGPYTLRIGNSGPGPETVLYEIWLR